MFHNISLFTFFSSCTILFTKLSRNFNEDVLCLDFLVCACVVLGISNTVGLGVGSGVGSGVQEFYLNFILEMFYF